MTILKTITCDYNKGCSSFNTTQEIFNNIKTQHSNVKTTKYGKHQSNGDAAE